MPKEIFRRVALERLSSPEQLDQLITITTPVGWLALLAIGGLLLSAIFWGIYGSIPTMVQGQGIILKSEGIHHIQFQNSGKIIEIHVEVGDMVDKGQIIARIEKSEFHKDRSRNNFLDPLRRFPNLRKGDEAETLRRFGNLRKGAASIVGTLFRL